jgi:hypothetical protein
MAATAIATNVVTQEQLDRCTRIIDMETMLPFYMVRSESDDLTEYKVATIWRHGRWFVTCSCPAGLRGIPCKHQRWAKAAAAEYKDELAIAARCAASVAPAITTSAQTVVGYTNVDAQTLARVLRRSDEKLARKPSKSAPLRSNRAFSLLK